MGLNILIGIVACGLGYVGAKWIEPLIRELIRRLKE